MGLESTDKIAPQFHLRVVSSYNPNFKIGEFISSGSGRSHASVLFGDNLFILPSFSEYPERDWMTELKEVMSEITGIRVELVQIGLDIAE